MDREGKIEETVGDMIRGSKIEDSDDFGYGGLYQVWVPAPLWNALELVTGYEADRD